MLNILIRVEGSDKEFTSVLPLVRAILASSDDNRVNIITDECYKVPSEWMPKRCYVFNIPDDKKGTVFGVHHFAANLHDVFNVDYFVDFVNDFHSAFLGLNFKAKKKIGLQGGPKTYLYNISMEAFTGMFLDQKKLSVLQHIPEVKESAISYWEASPVKEFENAIIDLSSINDPIYKQRVLRLTEAFEDIKLFGYVPLEMDADFDHPELAEKLELFTIDKKEILENIERFQLVISDSMLFSQLAMMKGRRSFIILEEDQNIETWSQMSSTLGILKFEGHDLVKYGIDEEKEMRVLSELEDYIINYYNLRVEPS
ncbi:hypothetical protein [Bacteriovorax sp. DB6_IX]|uniref:hypothetical protein n=1 Tax=Bacteriovorax sp. DB6_IX TaxID=1353530 RepID=UPI00038A39FC|nr:hypothetical protein [Bacteriovorax sp. DB6_IX]EQC49748.1 hypothetical protein M901_0255 [Bacteriovorax sp. DB6_IX]